VATTVKPTLRLSPEVAAQLQAAAIASPTAGESLAKKYLFHPEKFLQYEIGIRLFPGFSLDWVRDIAIGWLHGHARDRFNRTGEDPSRLCLEVRPDLPPWFPGDPVVNTFVFQGGAGLGKSIVVAGVLLWAARISKSFSGVVYAPFIDQAYRTTWRYLDTYIKGDWPGCRHSQFDYLLKSRKGAESAPAIELSSLHSISTKATNKGSARIQGQHAIVSEGRTTASVHVFEEADGIDDPAIFDAVKTMTGKGVALWMICLNPATATAPVQDLHGPSVKRYELSVLDHPNVKQGRDIIPGASNREWVEAKLGDWAEVVHEHNPKAGTFELDWLRGTIYKPRPPWWWRVLGKVPPSSAGDSAVSDTLYLTASARNHRLIFASSSPARGTLGIDVARSDAGDGDSGSITRRWRGCVQVRKRLNERDTRPYVSATVAELEEMLDGGCREVEVRIDNGGGFGGGVRDQLVDHDIGRRFDSFVVKLCDFGGRPKNLRRAHNFITEAYMAVARDLETLALVSPPPELRADLCARKLLWVVSTIDGGKADVLALESKQAFRKRKGRSPDDGDSVALACYPWSDVGGSWTEVSASMRWDAKAAAQPADKTHENEWLGKTPWDETGFIDGFDEVTSRWGR
jgi:hypothetical protein